MKAYLNCSYLPPELLAALNLEVERPWPAEIGSGENLLPYDYCPYSRAFLNEVTGKKGLFLLAASCDAMRRVYDVLTQKESAYLLEVPGTRSALDYYLYQLKKMLEWLEVDYRSKGFKEILKEKIVLYNYRRRLLLKLLDNLLNNCNPGFELLIEGVKLYYLNDIERLEELIERTAVKGENPFNEKPGVLICSTCLLDSSLITLIENSGLRIVGLDSCLGERSFNFQVAEDEADPLKSLARGYLNKSACPGMMDPELRLTEIDRLLTTRRAEGIIYFLPKFCDLAGYDFKWLKEKTREERLPLLLIEGEYRSGESGQLNTRVAAFRESLELRRKRD
jgi:benzoyl-CoA reductase/2-hydroxyglutaryl-CoA dehydratase subunit BcrC/BadD/HgdB